jgi:hypothetical protein
MRTFAFALLLPFAAACTESGTNLTGPTSAALSPSVAAAVDTAIQDEFHAEQIYLRVLADYGNVLPFFNVVVAEQRHSTALAGVLERRGLTAPTSEWTLDNVPRFASVAAACAAAADAEVANIALYDRLLLGELPTDVRNVFTNNRRASLEKHLPAFNACR